MQLGRASSLISPRSYHGGFGSALEQGASGNRWSSLTPLSSAPTAVAWAISLGIVKRSLPSLRRRSQLLSLPANRLPLRPWCSPRFLLPPPRPSIRLRVPSLLRPSSLPREIWGFPGVRVVRTRSLPLPPLQPWRSPNRLLLPSSLPRVNRALLLRCVLCDLRLPLGRMLSCRRRRWLLPIPVSAHAPRPLLPPPASLRLLLPAVGFFPRPPTSC